MISQSRKEQGMCRICYSADANTDVSIGSVDAQKSSGKTAVRITDLSEITSITITLLIGIRLLWIHI